MGSSTMVPKRASIEVSITASATVKVGRDSVRRSSRASSLSRSCRTANRARASTPTATGIHGGIAALPAAASPMLDRPKIRLAKPTAESTPESTSRRTGRGSVTLRTQAAPAARAIAAIGRTVKNSQRHERCSRITPPTAGPDAGATEITMEISPITRPRRDSGTTLSTVVISSGIMIAVPTACTTRPVSSRPNVGARPAIAVPAVNVPMARMNTARSDMRFSSQPVNGMTTAMVSMNPVVSHCAVAAVTVNSAMSRGSATDMMVSFRITTNAAETSRAMSRPVPGARASSSGRTATTARGCASTSGRAASSGDAGTEDLSG